MYIAQFICDITKINKYIGTSEIRYLHAVCHFIKYIFEKLLEFIHLF